jgi:uncharacterized membrane-anchored protein YjiN (DUF445 family)
MEALQYRQDAQDVLDDNFVFFFEHIMTSKSFEANIVNLIESLKENEPLHWRVQEINREYKKRKDARDGVQKSWSSDRGEALMRYGDRGIK